MGSLSLTHSQHPLLFCLLFLAGGLPILEALTPGLGAGRSFEFVNDPSDALQKVDERSQQGAAKLTKLC